ncbi:MAG: Gfo/Idh/MocA family protein [Chthonomonadales bacterium]
MRLDIVRLGIIGVSWWTDMVWPGFSQASNARVTWIASRTPQKARDYAETHGIPHWTGDYDELIAAPDVDAVFIAAPNFLHDELARRAFALNKHVLQEKPMALSWTAAAAQAEEARRRGLVLMVDQETRLSDGVRDLPELARNRLGRIRKVTVGMTLAERTWGGWRGDAALTGGSLFEMAIHQIDLARWLFGRNPVAVWARGEDTAGKDFTAVFDYGQGDAAVIDFCWRSIGFHQRIELYCEGGFVRQEVDMPVGDGFRTLVTPEGVERGPNVVGVQTARTFRRVLEGFARSILEGAEAPVPAEDGVWAVRMAEAARASLRSGVPVAF